MTRNDITYTVRTNDNSNVTFSSHPNGILVADINGVQAICYRGGRWDGEMSERVLFQTATPSLDEIQSAADFWLEENLQYQAICQGKAPETHSFLFILDAFHGETPIGRFKVFAESREHAIEQIAEKAAIPADEVSIDPVD